NGQDVTQRLGHLFLVYQQVTVMNPVSYKLLAGGSFSLGYFVFVMRKYQVASTAVYIHCFAQILHRHCTAFYMPSRPSWSPRTIPPRFASLLSFPQYEVKGVSFSNIHLNPGPGLEFFDALTG